MAAGATLLPELAPAATEQLVDLGGVVFYSFRDAAHGEELWKIDQQGRETLVKDINPGSADAMPLNREEHGIVAFDGSVFFAANDGVHGTSLWKSNGTEAGTVRVAELVTGAPPVPQITFGDPFLSASVGSFTPAGGKLFFTAPSGPFWTQEVWQTDGTTAGTREVPVHGVAAPTKLYDFTVSRLAPAGDGVAFIANDSHLWRTDGTPAGTVVIGDTGDFFSVAQAAPTQVGNTLFFSARPAGIATAANLWKSDANGAAPQTVKDFASRTDGSYAPEEMLDVAGTLFFTVRELTTKRTLELWKSDGTDAGTVMLASSADGTLPRVMSLPLAYGDRLIFLTWDGSASALWGSDGTAAGTRPLAPASLVAPVVAGGLVYFAKNPGELWQSDGTPAGTARAVDVDPRNGLVLSRLTDSDGAVFFAVQPEGQVGRVWRYKPGANNWPGADAGGVYGSDHAGGLYVLDRGADLSLDATRSSDVDGDALAYTWDVDGDGLFGDATGVAPSVPWARLAGLPPNTPVEVRVRVDDGRGSVIDSLPAILTIKSLPPVATYAGPAVVEGAASHTFTVTFTDGSGLDVSSLIGNNEAIDIFGPQDVRLAIEYLSIDVPSDGSPQTVTYRASAPGGAWDGADNGEYTVYDGTSVRDFDGVTTQGFRRLGSFDVKFRSGLPDLTASATSPLTGPVMGGTNGRARVAVRNDGTATAAGRFDVALWLVSPSPLFEPLVPLARQENVPIRLKPGQSRRWNFPFTVPDDVDTASYVVGGRVTPAAGQHFREFDTDNNSGGGPVVEVVKPSMRPVLQWPSGVDPQAVVPLVRGRRATVSVDVLNDGNFFPPTARWTIQLSATPEGGFGRTVLNARRRLVIAPGESRRVTLSFVVPRDLPAGSTYLVLSLANDYHLRGADYSRSRIVVPANLA